MEIRNYKPADAEACLRLFDAAGSSFYAEEERGRFARFLESPPGTYYVMENNGDLVGCGGFAALGEPETVTLTWGVIRRDLHGQGLGRFLLFYRLKEIGRLAGISQVKLETTPKVAGFFQKAGGFHITATETDGFGPGLDKVSMVKRLAVCK
ncbi:MAG: GNAT family N-acetyltransferase [Bryobacteraceae bacterium]|nr:GNAT family N-acetyltransferase [Bryobacteraceae bacterium]